MRRTFRFLPESSTGHARHCPYLLIWCGRFQDVAREWWTVRSRGGHRAGLVDSVQRIGGISRVGRSMG